MSEFASRYDNGDSIDLMAGGYYAGVNPASNALANRMSFIGPIGVGAMAISSRQNMRDRAFRTVLDLIDNPEYNRSCYETSVGLITLLIMSGNMPAPS